MVSHELHGLFLGPAQCVHAKYPIYIRKLQKLLTHLSSNILKAGCGMVGHELYGLVLGPAQSVHTGIHHQATRTEYLLTQVTIPSYNYCSNTRTSEKCSSMIYFIMCKINKAI
jgi:hypothetical protein